MAEHGCSFPSPPTLCIHLLLYLLGNVYLLQEEYWSQLLQSVDVHELTSKLIANERFQKNHHHTDEVSWMNYVKLLQVLLVSAKDNTNYKRNLHLHVILELSRREIQTLPPDLVDSTFKL